MGNRKLFASYTGKHIKPADTTNEEGAPAYAFAPKHALAQYAATGCFNRTFYAGAGAQLDAVLALCDKVDARFIAKCAVFARTKGYMKDMPAALCAVLAARRNLDVLRRIFPRVIDNGKMLRNFVQIIRSGVTGRKSFGHGPKKMIRHLLESWTPERLFRQSIGQKPSMADVIKMVHPKPSDAQRDALYGYLIGKNEKAECLPALVKAFERWKQSPSGELLDVPWLMMAGIPDLPSVAWKAMARAMPWHATRMNLNTFKRHDVFDDPEIVHIVAERLRNPETVRKVKVFPYQLLVAYYAATDAPAEIREALQEALDIALENVPALDGDVVLCPDVSGSMTSPVTGHRGGSTSVVSCVDVAGLFASAFLRKTPRALVLPFEADVVDVTLNPRDSVMTNTAMLAQAGGGTNCSAPLRLLNEQNKAPDAVIFISDNESWVDALPYGQTSGTEMMLQWGQIKSRNSNAKLVCIDIQPYDHTQAQERDDILNVGGFSDAVFGIVAAFLKGELDGAHWIGVIDKMEI